jgi:hypothetical protein
MLKRTQSSPFGGSINEINIIQLQAVLENLPGTVALVLTYKGAGRRSGGR